MDSDFLSAKRLYLERFGSAITTNWYLLVILLLSLLLHLGQLWFTWREHEEARAVKPLVIRIDEVGNATAVNYEQFEYKPQERELRYFLMKFVTAYFSRIPATVKDKYVESMYFLERSLAEKLADEERKSQSIVKFLRESNEDIDIEVKNVALEDLHSRPMRALVTFEKVYSSHTDHREIRRELYQGTFEFVLQDQVPNPTIPVNPLGLTITYFRVDQGFDGTRK